VPRSADCRAGTRLAAGAGARDEWRFGTRPVCERFTRSTLIVRKNVSMDLIPGEAPALEFSRSVEMTLFPQVRTKQTESPTTRD